MISFEKFVMEDGSPIYMQILLFMKRGIVAGTIRDGDELPSRRMLSALLGVNPNTVQKSYKLLEEEGLMRSQPGAASYIELTEAKTKAVRRELLEADAVSVIRAMQQMGLNKAEAIQLIERYWNEVER